MLRTVLKMATDAIISDTSQIYKRLFNHRPVLQNEVHFFVQEFETKRGDSDSKLLKDTMKLANEMDAVFLQEMNQSLPQFTQLKSNLSGVITKCDDVIQNKKENLDLLAEEKESLAKEIEDLRLKLEQEKEEFDKEMAEKIKTLKEEAEVHREQRNRLKSNRSRPSSATSESSATAVETQS